LFIEFVTPLIIPQREDYFCDSVYSYTSRGLWVNKSKGRAKGYYGKQKFTYNFYEPHLRDTPLRDKGIRVLTIGDSFVFGAYLNKEETMIYHFQEYADKEFGKDVYCFLNAGTGGWGIADYVAFVDDFVEKIKPDIILVILNMFDVERAVSSELFDFDLNSGLKRKEPIRYLFILKKCISSIPFYNYLIRYSKFLNCMRTQVVMFIENTRRKNALAKTDDKNHSIGGLNNFYDYNIKLAESLFVYLKEICKQRGIKLYVTTTGYTFLGKDNNFTRDFILHAKEFFKNIGVQFCDISSYNLERITEDRIDCYFFS